MTAKIKISYTVIFVTLCTIINIHEAQSECDLTTCNDICKGFDMKGTCEGNYCDCLTGKNCSALIEVTCDYVCEKLDFGLKGECEEDRCICKAETKNCPAWDCEKQCLDDPKSTSCEEAGGFVTPFACVKYAIIQTYICLCILPESNMKKLFEYSVTNGALRSPTVVLYTV